MSYAVHSIFYTVQGEGANAGRPAVFCRFSGCNLWSGREADRARAVCRFCDTEFVGTNGPGGGKFDTACDLARAVKSAWPMPLVPMSSGCDPGFVVCTGGEPALQLDVAAVSALHWHHFEVAVETNGTRPLPPNLDWVCVSPKAGTKLVTISGNELKLVYPQPGAEPWRFEGLDFRNFFLQPMWVADLAVREANVRHALDYCLANPRWRLSLQTHKTIGVP